MTTKEERIVERIEGASGGKGILRKEVLIDKEQMGEHCGLFGEVTLEPGAVLGYHEHHGETETYYILSGNVNLYYNIFYFYAAITICILFLA